MVTAVRKSDEIFDRDADGADKGKRTTILVTKLTDMARTAVANAIAAETPEKSAHFIPVVIEEKPMPITVTAQMHAETAPKFPRGSFVLPKLSDAARSKALSND